MNMGSPPNRRGDVPNGSDPHDKTDEVIALQAERRESARFPVHLELHYRGVYPGADTSTGIGRTLDISSSGILFSAQEQIPLGRSMEVSVTWPARLEGSCPLKLVAVGSVVRSEGNRTAVRILRYEFRTKRSALTQAAG
jgi:hypothetical protein